MKSNLTFRQFVELEEVKPSYLDKISSELNVDPKAVQDSPYWAASINMGKFSHNGIMYTAKYTYDSEGNISGAMIKPIHTGRTYTKDSKDRMVQVPGKHEAGEKFVTKQELEKMLTQGMQQAPDPMGGMGGALPGL